MTYYACIAIGLADCTPNSQEYISAETADEFSELVKSACQQWERDLPEADETRGDEFYAYEFCVSRDGEDNYSQRLRIAASDDWVLDVIGMTADDYERESGDA